MDKPLIQIDDNIREMTDEEYEAHLANIPDYHPTGTPDE